jgi:hypothetical protein
VVYLNLNMNRTKWERKGCIETTARRLHYISMEHIYKVHRLFYIKPIRNGLAYFPGGQIQMLTQLEWRSGDIRYTKNTKNTKIK